MNCEEYKVLISCSLDGELDEREQQALEEHIQACPACRDYLHALEALREELQAPIAPPPALQERVLSAVKADIQRKKIRRLWRYGSLAACAVLVIGVSMGFIRADRAKSAAPLFMMATATEDNAYADPESYMPVEESYPLDEEAPASMEMADTGKGAEFARERSALTAPRYANGIITPESIARSYLQEHYDTDFGEATITPWEDGRAYTPLEEAYTPVGEITAVQFSDICVLVDENMRVFAIMEEGGGNHG